MSLPRTLLSCAIVTLFALSAGYPAQAADPHQGQHGSAEKMRQRIAQGDSRYGIEKKRE